MCLKFRHKEFLWQEYRQIEKNNGGNLLKKNMKNLARLVDLSKSIKSNRKNQSKAKKSLFSIGEEVLDEKD